VSLKRGIADERLGGGVDDDEDEDDEDEDEDMVGGGLDRLTLDAIRR
jgi:hypothetical protein